MTSEIAYSVIAKTPVGAICLAASVRGLYCVTFCAEQEVSKKTDDLNPDATSTPQQFLFSAEQQLLEYFDGRRQTFDVALDLSRVSAFTRNVLQETGAIPFGSLATYGQLAAQVGNVQAARAMGRALALNPLPILIPCHRVLGKGGDLHGFSAPGGLLTKATLLRLEGHQVQENKVLFT